MDNSTPDPMNSNGAEPVYGPAYPGASHNDSSVPADHTDASEPASHDPRAQSGPVAAPPDDAPEPPYTAPYPPYPSDPPPTYGMAPNIAAGMAYMTPIPAVFFLLSEPYREHPLIRLHSWQSIFFFLLVAIVKAVLSVLAAVLPSLLMVLLTSLVSIVLVALWLFAIVQAFNGKRPGVRS